MPQKFIDRPAGPMLVLGAFILVASIIFSWSFYSARGAQNTISVTGSAKTTAMADSAKWTIEVYQLAFQSDLQSAYGQVDTQVAAVKAYLASQQLASTSITTDTTVADQ